MCLRVLKESNKSRFDRYCRHKQCIHHIPYITFRDCRVHIFPKTFLEIAVYNEIRSKQYDAECGLLISQLILHAQWS